MADKNSCLCLDKPCGPYVRLSGRIEVNVSALTGSGATGNYSSVATVAVHCCGRVYDVPVLTGNSLKHWHAYYTAQVYEALGGSCMNLPCRLGVGLRGYTLEAAKPSDIGKNYAKNEVEAIQDLCNDLHGFLQAKGDSGGAKRDSLVRLAFAIPLLEKTSLENAAKARRAVTHNRVDPFKGEKATEMMVFKNEYVSAVYGIAASMDLAYTLVPLYSSCSTTCSASCSSSIDDERKRRWQAAITALLPLLTGSGSKQARALPIARPLELVAAVSSKPLPNLVHGSYPDYLERSLDILSAYAKVVNESIAVICWPKGDKCSSIKAEGIEVVPTASLREFFEKLVEEEANKCYDACKQDKGDG